MVVESVTLVRVRTWTEALARLVAIGRARRRSNTVDEYDRRLVHADVTPIRPALTEEDHDPIGSGVTAEIVRSRSLADDAPIWRGDEIVVIRERERTDDAAV